MEEDLLSRYVPEGTLPILKKWFGNLKIHIKITRDRTSKLGDYRKTAAGQFVITINHNLPSELFFFVLSHEMAHLFAFEKYGQNISAHGKEWKHTFREMLVETLHLYAPDLQPHIAEYARAPKANFSASPKLKAYFYPQKMEHGEFLIDQITPGEIFIFKSERYRMQSKRRKNFLCTRVACNAAYVFRPHVKVRKVE